MLKIKRALISVSDKTGLEEFVKTLNEFGIEIFSTGGTARRIKESGIQVVEVSDYTGFPEMMDGRVKTLHPKIHASILALRDNPEHMEQVNDHGIKLIDMVVVNLYPFEKVISKKDVTFEEAIENIDIGGPSMLRSAAKNFKSVAVITDPANYPAIIEELKENNGALSESTLKRLAEEVFKKTSEYDSIIYNFLSTYKKKKRDFPDIIDLKFSKVQDLRYGENPHQKAAFYKDISSCGKGIAYAKKLQGKELSFNNILDLNAALEIVSEFKEPACVIIKHTNPCGAAVAENLCKAYIDALDCDRLSAFGSIVAFNRTVDGDVAELVMKEADFVECILAPGFGEDVKKVFSKKKNLRLLELADLEKISLSEKDYRKVLGGVLIQEMDLSDENGDGIRVVTKKLPTQEETTSLLFGWKLVKHVKSNAIVFSQGTKTVGIGAGQMSRVDSVIIAARKAGERSRAATLASDAFFPKKDAVEKAHEAGVSAIIQPGGSIRDQEVIDTCDELGISMVFTGRRHFKH